MITLNQLADPSVDVRISSGIKKLDRALSGGKGFKSGIYDISTTIGPVGLGCYEILFNIIINNLTNNNNNNNSKILVLQTFNKIPWFKLKKCKKFKPEFNNKINCLNIRDMFDLISLFNKRKNFIDSFTIIIIDSFSILNSNSIKILKNSINNNSINEPIIRFYQSMRKFFHIMQKFCSLKNKFIFTTGGMEIFNQRIIITNDNDDFSDNEDISLKSNYINQQILVPTISLKSDINSYFNNRIIIYRDWVMENSNNELISGLNNSNPNIFQESINLLNSGNLKCLPHFLCIDNNSNNSVNESPQSGYFLIDNNFNIVDIESNVLNSDVFVDNDDDDIEIPDSQEW